MRLYLARHGETTWNLERRYQGHGDSPLSRLGEEQARCLATRMAAEPLDAVYASDSERAWRTAEAIVAGRPLPVLRDPDWREIGYGEWEGLTRPEIAERFPEAWARRLSDPLDYAPPGGETRRDAQRRVVAAFHALAQRHAGETVLVVTHAGILTMLVAWLKRLEIGSEGLPTSSNCGLHCVTVSDGRPEIEFWDDASHVRPSR